LTFWLTNVKITGQQIPHLIKESHWVTSIHIVRHAHVHNPQKIVYGRLPRFRLSEDGVQQAKITAKVLANRPLSVVFSSPMLRARQTARIIAAEHPALKVKISRYLQEVHTPYDGQPIEELEKIGWEFYRNVQPPYETPLDILNRVRRLIQKIRREYCSQEVVAVTHGDIVCFIIAWVSGEAIDGETKRRFTFVDRGYPATASITTLRFQTDSADEIPSFEYIVPYAEQIAK
jgi:broad specificity phosphatase PhoE